MRLRELERFVLVSGRPCTDVPLFCGTGRDRVAVVTGGGTGIGKAIAIRLAQDGADGTVKQIGALGGRM